eukprot:s4389_g5.t1
MVVPAAVEPGDMEDPGRAGAGTAADATGAAVAELTSAEEAGSGTGGPEGTSAGAVVASPSAAREAADALSALTGTGGGGPAGSIPALGGGASSPELAAGLGTLSGDVGVEVASAGAALALAPEPTLPRWLRERAGPFGGMYGQVPGSLRDKKAKWDLRLLKLEPHAGHRSEMQAPEAQTVCCDIAHR